MSSSACRDLRPRTVRESLSLLEIEVDAFFPSSQQPQAPPVGTPLFISQRYSFNFSMRIGSLHVVDILIILSYLAIVVYVGRRAAAAASNQEGFFLAGRKLGKLYQFFLYFGNATDANGAVSTTFVSWRSACSSANFACSMLILAWSS